MASLPARDADGLVSAMVPRHARILVVDDEEPIRRAVARVLKDAGYEAQTAGSAAEARERLAESAFDLMLCDIIMPNESGISLLSFVHEHYPELAVIMVTAVDDPRTAEPVARYGAYGYILKPFAASAIVINVAGALQRRAEAIAERMSAEHMQIQLDERAVNLAEAARQLEADAEALSASREETVDRLAITAEWRDPHTGKHLHQISRYSRRLAELAGRPAEEAELLGVASKLHDIGKIALPDHILRSTGPLTPEERLAMQQHPIIGAEILRASDSPIVRMGSVLALTHHEWWDGSGYPKGLARADIPLEGRIVAIADVFDALCSVRPYKQALPTDAAIAVMRAERGTHFDPELLDLFLDDVERRGEDAVGPVDDSAQSAAT